MKQICFFTLSIFFSLLSIAQKPIEGAWEGRLNTGSFSLRLVFHLKKDAGFFTGTMDSPDQGAKDIALTKVTLVGDSLGMEVANIGGKASGRLVNDTVFVGQWSQSVASLPLELKKVAHPSTVNRPQTPKPPFPYAAEDVIYANKDHSIQYGATITIPQGEGSFPAVILITGSGQQNRDEELFGHKPFAVIADFLTRQGYVVLRVDDRGIGKTTGNADSATSRDYADDVNVGLDYLRSRKEVDKSKIGMLGHSEGGMIAQIVAAERPDIAFVISLAGPGEKITDLMREQSKAIMESAGASKEVIDASLRFNQMVIIPVITAPTDTIARLAAKTIFANLFKNYSKATIEAATGVTGEQDLMNLVGVYRQPWMRYFFQYNPDQYIRKMKGKVLVLNGEKDIQVVSKSNLAGWKASLAKSGVKKYDVVELPGLNHLFQHCKTCSVPEYAQIEETISPEVLEIIGNWMKANVK